MDVGAGVAERTRAVILDAATHVLARQPDAAMNDIAEVAGVGRATLYRHFATREELVAGASERAVQKLSSAIKAARLGDLPADRALAHLTAMFIRTGSDFAALGSLVDNRRGGPATNQRSVKEPIRTTLRRGIREHVLRDDIPLELLFEMYGALVVRSLWLTAAGTVTPEQATDIVMSMFIDGARAR